MKSYLRRTSANIFTALFSLLLSSALTSFGYAQETNCAINLLPEAASNPKLDIIKESSFKLINHPTQSLLLYWPKFGGNSLPIKPVKLNISVPQDIQHHWTRQIWKVGYKSYLFLDFGSKNLEAESQYRDRQILHHIAEHPYEPILIPEDPGRTRDWNFITNLREEVNKQVLNRFQEVKKYLNDEDFSVLNTVDTISENNDAFGIFDIHRLPVDSRLLPTDLTKNLVMTGQISYFGNLSTRYPQAQTLIETLDPQNPSEERNFPFTLRLSIKKAREIKRFLRARYELNQIGEITRFAKLSNDLPNAIRDKLILQIFNKRSERETQAFIASMDPHTYRLFSTRYHFEKLLDFQTQPERPNEILAFLDTRSEKFKDLCQELKRSASQVQVYEHPSFQW